ncbi:MAG: replicative DNA helicase [Verrucomicrobia bacterium]|nr:replicative DNA helicase [Verrucomicrobiota bacterium]
MTKKITPHLDTKSDRIPPYSERAERCVLGASLVDAARVIDLAIERQLTPESFYVPANRSLFSLLVEMSQSGQAVDLLTVGERLRDAGQLDSVGGMTNLENLVDETPTAANAEHYIDIVHQKFVLREIIEKAREAIDECYEAEQDADEILNNTEQSFFRISELKHDAVRPWGDMVKQTMENIESIFQGRVTSSGIPTGFSEIDQLLLGLQPSDMIILAARPSMGKTSLAMNIAENAAIATRSDPEARPVAIFSLEMSSEQLVRRMVCSRARVPSQRLREGFTSPKDHGDLMQSADALLKANIYLDDTPGLTALELRSRARRMKRRFDIGLVVVDYLQLLHYPQFGKEGRQRETAAISGALKAMAKELSIPVLVLSQLSRAPETRGSSAIPKLSDLRDSGSIEQDADVVCLLRRPSKYPDDPDFDDKRLAIVDIAKHRNGPTGQVKLNFEEEYTRFENRSREMDPMHGFEPTMGEDEI